MREKGCWEKGREEEGDCNWVVICEKIINKKQIKGSTIPITLHTLKLTLCNIRCYFVFIFHAI